MIEEIPEIGSRWQHKNGNFYTVIMIFNSSDTSRPDEYPITIGYRGDNGNLWARPLWRWYRSMTLISNPGEKND